MTRSIRTAFALAAVALVAGCSNPPSRPVATQAGAAAHVERASAAAGSDLQQLMVLCKPAPAARASHDEVDKGVAAQIARPAPEPGKAFDNLYFVGDAWVSAWALRTSQGIILIDALNNGQEASTLIEGGMRKLGLDPKDIRYIIVTHAHGDHYGGVNYLVERYHPRVVMSAPDWKMAETGLEFESTHWGPVPRRDIVANDGDVVTLGDTRVTLYLTPGHTGGTISPVFEVKSGTSTHRALLWGGTAFNFGKDIPRLDSYIASTRRMMQMADAQGIDVMLSNHPGYDDTVAKLARLRAAPQQTSNPFVLGTPTVKRGLTVMNECAQAARDRFLL